MLLFPLPGQQLLEYDIGVDGICAVETVVPMGFEAFAAVPALRISHGYPERTRYLGIMGLTQTARTPVSEVNL